MNANTLQSRILGTAIALAGTVGLALPVNAGTPAGKTHEAIVVQYADLNLASPAGAKALYARLGAAADKACGGAPTAQALGRQVTYRACYDRAMEKAVAKVGQPLVRAVHAARVTSYRVG